MTDIERIEPDHRVGRRRPDEHPPGRQRGGEPGGQEPRDRDDHATEKKPGGAGNETPDDGHIDVYV